jgi:hypothetical protein
MNKKALFRGIMVTALLYIPLSLFGQSRDFEMNGTVLVKYRGNAENVIIPKGVTAIKWRAFWGCGSLTSVTIPSSVTAIEDDAFAECDSLTNITVDSLNLAYLSVDGVLFSKHRTVDRTVLLQYPIGKQESTYTIPIPSGDTSIGNNAFKGCGSLTSVIIPLGVTAIGNGAFAECKSLTNITISSSVTDIGDNAFMGCDSLTGITIPSSVILIGWGAFSFCSSLTGVTIPSSVYAIGDWAFDRCENLTGVTVSRKTNIGRDVFPDNARITYSD